MGYKDYNYRTHLVTELEEGLIHVQLNNPKSYNAFAEKDWRDYSEILLRLDADTSVNVIVISSTSPKSFSSGLNLKDAMATFGSVIKLSEEDKYKHLHQHIVDFQFCIGTPSRINTPTIAVLNGINYGLALDIASACSIRIATADARFSIREIKIGIPADIGSLQRMPGVINNKSLLFQYALTGEIFGAEQAQTLGFVSKVLPSLDEAVKHAVSLGEEINGHQQWAIKGTKKFIQDRVDNERSTTEGLQDVAHYNATNIDGKFLKAVSSIKL